MKFLYTTKTVFIIKHFVRNRLLFGCFFSVILLGGYVSVQCMQGFAQSSASESGSGSSYYSFDCGSELGNTNCSMMSGERNIENSLCSKSGSHYYDSEQLMHADTQASAFDEEQEGVQPFFLSELSPELVCEIFKFLNEDSLAKIALTCKKNAAITRLILEPIKKEDVRRFSEPYKGNLGSALLYTARNGIMRDLRILVCLMGVDINYYDLNRSYLETPLLVGIKAGHADVVRYLLKKGACVTFKNKDDMMPDDTKVEMFPVSLAASNGRCDIVKLLVECGHAEVNEVDRNGNTPLHNVTQTYAAMPVIGSLDTVHYLLDQGADINAINKFDETPLIYAAANGHDVAIVQALVKRGADLEHKAQKRPPIRYYGSGWSTYGIQDEIGKDVIEVNRSNGIGYTVFDVAKRVKVDEAIEEYLIQLYEEKKAIRKNGTCVCL